MAQCELHRKYTLSVPGMGRSTADSIGGLQIQGSTLSELTERAMHDTLTIWLDIQAPTPGDVAALERVFGIDIDTAQKMQMGALGSHVDPGSSTHNHALYVCWAEVTDDTLTSEYLQHGRYGPIATSPLSDTSGGWSGGYVPVPPWMQPSATQVLSRFNLQRRVPKGESTDIPDEPQWEDARRLHVQETLRLIAKPVVASKARLRSVVRRWGQDAWFEVASADSQHEARDPAWLTEQLAQNARELLGYRIVQVWMHGPVLLTLHRHASAAIAKVSDGLHGPTTPLSIIQLLAERWVHATASGLRVIEQHTDVLDADLTRPVRAGSFEAANWTPVIARCRKASLALLRRCQINKDVLDQLCTAQCTTTEHHILHQQINQSLHFRGLFKKAEQRLSRLHRILLDRQRLRLLSTQKQIHRYFRILVTVELVFLPIELWYNVDNLNGITTPGELQPEKANDEDFWLTVLGMIVWAVAAILIYAVYTKFFERK
ncbi:hypothetical protein LPJ77_001804 [Coemansia sp. RSA 2523]|nr:hypothetical protein LPJ58_003024 [Coemansia sp. RSA 1591]KAJ1778887.1 hypothetical protein LPJ54_001353 [Coemansia sp. RSA 1824]KAJ1787917.1 hypothetical protein LPJ62_003140 [Coemansia sp. RSA 2167]KAJ1788377.1 hypothetical protein LPJ67_002898 [Coemansia sp. RSA 1938]KAJ1809218.1 hypothetical protein LPJ77_001804 [Coemansia sp. RSA 2523]KAJ2256368.1 hypothetical protein GGH98_001550 [Coemansia sp. RSA 454]KAJ2405988.1 hypothetical protein J3F80_003793 [Coemansia sp. RSA 2526]KAJ2428566